jgi:hypothetical protein
MERGIERGQCALDLPLLKDAQRDNQPEERVENHASHSFFSILFLLVHLKLILLV